MMNNSDKANHFSQAIERIKQEISMHSIKLNSPLSQHAVEDFEASYNIRLPEAYRRFLLEVGDGGDGPPYYALVRLADAVRGQYERNPQTDERERFRPDLPFPITDNWVWVDQEIEEDDRTRSTVSEHGHLFLGTDGCGIDWIIIITGEERGNVWYRDEYCALKTDISRRDFLGWYEYWLDCGRDRYFDEQSK